MKPTVLIVEDDPMDLEILRESVKDEFDYHAVSSLSSATMFLRDHNPAVILLDLTLQDSASDNTLSVIKQMRQKAALVIVSGNEVPEFIAICIAETANGYLPKSKLKPSQVSVELFKAIKNNSDWLRQEEAKQKLVSLSL